MFGLGKIKMIIIGAVLLSIVAGVAIKKIGDARENKLRAQDQEQSENARNAGDEARNETDDLDDSGILDSLRETGGLREDE